MPLTEQEELELLSLEREKYGIEQPQLQSAELPSLQGTIPQMFGRRLAEAGKQTYQEAISPVLSGLSTAAFGLPKSVIPESVRQKIFPEQKTFGGKALRFGSEAGGYIVGGGAKLAAKAAGAIPKLAGQGLLKTTTRGAIGGGVYGATQSMPWDEGLALQERPSRIMQGAIAGGVLSGLWKTIKVGKHWLNTKNQTKLAEETRNSFQEAKDNLMKKYKDVYEQTIKQREGQVSLQEPLLNLIDESDDIVNTIKGNIEVSEALAKGEPNARRVMNIINTFMEKPQEIQRLTLQEADNLQKYIRNLPSLRSKLATQYKGRPVDFTNADRVLLGFANDIKAQVLNLAPEMSLVNREYAQFMNNYKQVRGLFKAGNAIKNFREFHNLDPELRTKVTEILPKDVLGNIMQMNRVERARKILGIVVGGGAGAYVAHRYLSGKILGKD